MPLTIVLVVILGATVWLDGAAARLANQALVIHVSAADAGWDSTRLGEDGLVEAGRDAATDPALRRPEVVAARRLSDAGASAEAVAALEQIVHEGERDPSLWNELGVHRLRAGDLNGARAALDSALLAAPGYLRAHFNRAIARGRAGDAAGAREDYTAVLAAHPEDFEATFNLGLLELESGDVAAATALLERAVTLGGNEGKAHALCALAVAQSRAGARDTAVYTYERAIEFKPDYLLPRFNQAALLAGSNSPKDVARAGRLLEQLLRLAPDYAPAYFLQGRIASQAGDSAAAMALYERAAGLDRRFWKAHYNWALVALDRGKLDIARPLFEGLERDFADRAEPPFNLGRIAYRDERFDDAVAAYDRALARRPNYPQARLNRGLALDASGKLEDALAAFKAIADDPEVGPAAMLNQGLVLDHLGRPEDAKAALLAAETAKPGYAVALFNLGRLESKAGRRAEAVAYYQRALASDPQSSKAAVNLGVERAKTKDWAGAILAYRQALEVAPGDPEALFNLGVAFRQAGQLDEAIAAYQQLLASDAENIKAMKNLAVAQGASKRNEEAVATLRAALELMPSDTALRFNLARQLEILGRVDEALGELGRAVKLRPTYAKAVVTQARLLRARGDAEGALAVLAPALAVKKPQSKVRLAAAAALIELKRPADAQAHLEVVLTASPTDAWAISLLLVVSPEAGAAKLQAALALKPDSPALKRLVERPQAERGQ